MSANADRTAPIPGVRRFQPGWATYTGAAVWLWAALTPPVWLLSDGTVARSALAWALTWAALMTAAWFGVRPATALDLRERRIVGNDRVRVRDAVGWGRSGREGWVRVHTDGGVRTIATEPDEAEAVYTALRAWGAPSPATSSMDGFTLEVEGGWTPNGLDAVMPVTALAAVSAIGWQFLSRSWATGDGWLGVLDLVLAVAVGVTGALAMLAASWAVRRLASLTVSRGVTVRGARLEVRQGLEVATLELRGPVQLTLYAIPQGAELIVRSAAGSLVIPGMTRDLTFLRDALAAVRPTEGTEADLPPALTRMQRAGEAGDPRRVAPGGRAVSEG